MMAETEGERSSDGFELSHTIVSGADVIRQLSLHVCVMQT